MSKKIGSKLAESVKQKRSNAPADTARPDARPAASSPLERTAPAAAERSAKRTVQEPSASHGVLHPSRIWPD